ncbi:unnamed protein product [Paramecium sonneborni]|uniref:Uncharacterized protein n=1 Tax=Paramecium sonneborni TaxID=65129 RepID=A0A8S1L8Q8_9CILI|nr:unnamed protein product [Paramecium sonneborni]
MNSITHSQQNVAIVFDIIVLKKSSIAIINFPYAILNQTKQIYLNIIIQSNQTNY